jgi:hypothetical protein
LQIRQSPIDNKQADFQLDPFHRRGGKEVASFTLPVRECGLGGGLRGGWGVAAVA